MGTGIPETSAAIDGLNVHRTPKINKGMPTKTGPYFANIVFLHAVIIRITTYSPCLASRCKARGKKKAPL